MANKFISVLEAIGHDFKVALDKIMPFAFAAGGTIVPLLDPSIAPLFQATVGVVAQTEQKFAAMGQQSGTGVQKSAEALSILGPLLSQGLAVAGKPADQPTVQNYLNAVVALLNAVPAAPAPAAPVAH